MKSQFLGQLWKNYLYKPQMPSRWIIAFGVLLGLFLPLAQFKLVFAFHCKVDQYPYDYVDSTGTLIHTCRLLTPPTAGPSGTVAGGPITTGPGRGPCLNCWIGEWVLSDGTKIVVQYPIVLPSGPFIGLFYKAEDDVLSLYTTHYQPKLSWEPQIYNAAAISRAELMERVQVLGNGLTLGDSPEITLTVQPLFQFEITPPLP
jgi:hypothetical protein